MHSSLADKGAAQAGGAYMNCHPAMIWGEGQVMIAVLAERQYLGLVLHNNACIKAEPSQDKISLYKDFHFI
jgi:hypothetical protein